MESNFPDSFGEIQVLIARIKGNEMSLRGFDLKSCIERVQAILRARQFFITHCEVEGHELHLQVVQQSLMSWNTQNSDESSMATMMDNLVHDLRDTRHDGLSLARIYSNLLMKKLKELTQNAEIRDKLPIIQRNSEYHRPA